MVTWAHGTNSRNRLGRQTTRKSLLITKNPRLWVIYFFTSLTDYRDSRFPVTTSPSLICAFLAGREEGGSIVGDWGLSVTCSLSYPQCRPITWGPWRGCARPDSVTHWAKESGKFCCLRPFSFSSAIGTLPIESPVPPGEVGLNHT